jgi:hypothetical protein
MYVSMRKVGNELKCERNERRKVMREGEFCYERERSVSSFDRLSFTIFTTK